MAIDTFAKSLIADAKKKNKQRQRDELKSTFGSVFGTLIGSGIKSVLETKLEQKKNTFLQNEEVLATKLKYKSAVNDASTFLDTQQKIKESGKNEEDYFFDVLKPLYKETALTTGAGVDNKVLDAGISGNERLFQVNLHDALRPKAKELAEQHKKGLEIAQALGEYKDFNTFVNTKIKSVRPENITDAAVNTFRNLFSGKSSAEQEEEVLKLIRSGVLSTNAKAMADFNEEYKNSRSAIRSFNFMDSLNQDVVDKIIAEEPDVEKETTGKFQTLGDQVFLVKNTKETNKITGEVTDTPTRELVSSSDDPATLAKQFKAIADLQKISTDILTPSANADYRKKLIANDINIYQIKDFNDYSKATNFLSEYTSKSQNLKDGFKDEMLKAILSQYTSGSLQLNESLISISDPGSEQSKEFLERFQKEKLSIGALAEYLTDTITALKDNPQKVVGLARDQLIKNLKTNDPNITDTQIEDLLDNGEIVLSNGDRFTIMFDKDTDTYFKVR